MRTGEFTGFNVALKSPGIAWIQFNTPDRLNGLTHRIKRDLVETINQAQMDNAVRLGVHGQWPSVLRWRYFGPKQTHLWRTAYAAYSSGSR